MKSMYVYILKCSDSSYYTGMTNNLDRRIIEHIEGNNVECYTYRRRPVELVFYELCNDPNQTIELEKKIKGWSRLKKEALIAKAWDELHDLSLCKNSTSYKNYKKK